jgi:hypothetical protein
MPAAKGNIMTCLSAEALVVLVLFVVEVPPQATSSIPIKARKVGRSLVINFLLGRIRDYSL